MGLTKPIDIYIKNKERKSINLYLKDIIRGESEMSKLYRKITILLIICMMACGFSGCGSIGSKNNGQLKVVSTIFASYDFARQIGGTAAEITMLLKPGVESHSYEPSPKDIITIKECDIFIYTGGENDAWVDGILETMDTSKMTIIKMLDLVDKYEEETVEGMENHEHTEDCGHEETEWDEHVWTSPVNAITICEAITEAFIAADSGNKAIYEENSKNYISELKKLDETFRKVVGTSNRRVIVFGDRFPLRYFVEEYNLEYYAAFPGCSSETEASAATIAFLIDKVKEEEIPVVFKIELSSDSMAQTIAEDTGAKVLTFNTCHNITSEEFEKGENYLTLMYKNANALKEAVQ